MAAIAYAFKDFLMCAQKQGEIRIDCVRLFKAAQEVFPSCLGSPIELKKTVKLTLSAMKLSTS